MTRLLTALALLAALAVTGCGGDKKTIPADDARSLMSALRDARDNTGDPDKCPQLTAAVRRVQSRVANLPDSVDKDTRDSLVNGVNNLIDNAQTECRNTQTTPTTPTTPDTTPTAPPETTPPQTNTTPTAPPQTTPTTPTQPTPTTPGNGNGNGNGNGGTPPGQNPGTATGQDKQKKPKDGKKEPK